MTRNVAIILAGGLGKRMNAKTPKQFLSLRGQPLIMYSLKSFSRNDLVSHIVIVCLRSWEKKLKTLVHKADISKVFKIIPGGKTRQESSFIGVKNCPPKTDFVLIHDAARPFVDKKIIKNVLNAARKYRAGGPVTDVEDTLIVKKGKFIEKIPERASLKRIQTPQGFSYDLILKAHQRALRHGIRNSTDDCGLVLAFGKKVRVVKGSELNMKIANKKDLLFAQKIIEEGQI